MKKNALLPAFGITIALSSTAIYFNMQNPNILKLVCKGTYSDFSSDGIGINNISDGIFEVNRENIYISKIPSFGSEREKYKKEDLEHEIKIRHPSSKLITGNFNKITGELRLINLSSKEVSFIGSCVVPSQPIIKY